MAEASGNEIGRSREMAVATNLSLDIDRFPRDLLRGFRSGAADNDGRSFRSKMFYGEDCTDVDEESEIELNLGLSLGGRFGVDKTPGKLKRSSSIVGTMPIFSEQDETSAAIQPLDLTTHTSGLKRSTSLPTEMEEEWRKRKEMQMLRRMEAKRRRCEKQKSGRSSNSGNSDGLTALLQKDLGSSKQGSGDSDGGGRRRGSSSSLSELESKNQQGSSNNCGGEGRSLSIITGCSSQERTARETTDQKPDISEAKAEETEKPWKDRKGKDKTSEVQLEMPCVTTKGEGPNGRRIQGILYKYGKGEEVRIMCVCHGSFLSPAEFVKHAGGGDVDHPLRHIVVNTSTFS
ncbi:PREDICTED: ninja-family protein AFP2 [Tarenaya hassleriana]|uniref:ninja-family protein AFP2 n=1 Tax=Tarenaya hassleriana TaxID=28532 RepID=UPI00053C6D85|nr:PREDICTED: ninja-family protein AFP2 [Tarenaya hassleriana]XP_010527972.1 PREDICTED: ninja-family protein AFP2 [Tarenaya hassleriana]XP_019057109.1 PREDICTED: ninja-family protein AFP2 [Tarenaya hassleriana]